MAVNEPDGIACIWNLHLLERPEFVFHAQVRFNLASSRPTLSRILFAVGRPFRLLLSLPPQPPHRRDLLGSNPPMGHPFTTPQPRTQVTSLCNRSHPPRLLSLDDRDSKRSQPHLRFNGRNRLRVDSRPPSETARSTIPRTSQASQNGRSEYHLTWIRRG